MRFMIVTGMSGSGKSSVLKMLEDMGFFCVDNLPIQLIPKFAELAFDKAENMELAALGVDIRSNEPLEELEEVLKELVLKGYSYEILFLDADTNILVKRFKETRRTHPLSEFGRIDQAIELEREKLAFLKQQANYIVDTSQLLVRELKEEIDKIISQEDSYTSFNISVMSFGFKYGIPLDADLVFDVRFLPNPFYVSELKHRTGNEQEVSSYVMSSGDGAQFLDKLDDMLLFLVPLYIKEGKNSLVVAIGCTGGKHRSVTIANGIAGRLEKTGCRVKLDHRDMEKN
ncbi:RNase adapter RapZ [Anaerolentibacter hominis]|uniref:RNase adapter RapZ n=1 Tax=Anaerolentibacter hominis TaxID=3079009 RepID=UPI0031B8B318